MSTLKANHGVVVGVKKAKTKKGVLKYIITTSNGATHWVGSKFIENYLYAYDLEGKSPLTAMIGARATWQEQTVVAGQPVIGSDNKQVVKDGQPQVYKESGKRYEQLDIVPSDVLIDRRSEMEDKQSIKAKFAGVNLFSAVAAPVAAPTKEKAVVNDEEEEEEPVIDNDTSAE